MKTRTIIAIVVAMYFLASGPIFRLVEERVLPEMPVMVLYSPFYLLGHIPIVREALGFYLQLWMLPPAD